ncbi:hypothetical protein [Kitasatospora sp. NPDC001175]|uniref:hypothetical protein n=1 Tax=Kitasatospora sp. NPDC001175 TaxID=3157103 RepID=UPI003CFE73D6
MFAGHLLDAVLEGAVLGNEDLDGFAGDHLVEVADLAHEFADSLPLGQDLPLGAGELCSAFRARSRQVASIWSCRC